MKILTIFSVLILSGCTTVSAPHVPIEPTEPPVLPYYDRETLDCKKQRELCRRIREREELLKYDAETLRKLIDLHNKQYEEGR